ncbi:MAG: peptide chain release factor N(5)-glutamine methyltransferase [Cyclobacteriaceae bacterium]
MKNSKVLFQEIVGRIRIPEDPQEIDSLAYLLFECVLGISKTDVMAGKEINLSQDQALKLQQSIVRINDFEPVQYVVGEAFFYGRKFTVNPAVLIPRPETEELIRVVVEYKNSLTEFNPARTLRVLDIGTGSGCIAISLFHETSPAEVYATDVSTDSLAVAAQNAESLHAEIHLLQHDILKDALTIKDMDVLVSNPPYVRKNERENMNRNVIDYEPHLALFVPDDEPLIFYSAIVKQSQKILNPHGLLVVEINEKFGKEVLQLFVSHGFKDVVVIRDVNRKDRIVRGINPLRD